MEPPRTPEGTSQPHLLTLPREIRDLIYGFLTHEVIVETDIGITLPEETGTISERCGSICYLELPSCPFHSVLLVHPQLYAEYMASSVFSRLSVTLHMTITSTSQSAHRADELLVALDLPNADAAKSDRQLSGMLKHVQHLNIRVSLWADVWINAVQDVVKMAVPDQNRISTISVEFPTLDVTMWTEVDTFTDSIPLEILDMRMVQSDIRDVKHTMTIDWSASQAELERKQIHECLHFKYAKDLV
ncbi:hypothetical protein P154DRAFT_164906 [Amniculicola lignicola CBS 123094]|uniref:F-box domain-containing protein n=1 Tax=Amniculicola lignicola CBS 123094 TaxID=1392246 RepID=A0A6A5WI79_9PLEO|nr:hypothetical protein P154DRAFT_164906 [Amniculicola lignicola CBS 123094]